MSLRLGLVGLLCLVAGLGPLAAAEAGKPTRSQWEPIAQAIEADGVAARSRLQAFMADRTWAEGWLQLAELDREAGDIAATYDHAREALASLRRSGRQGEAVDELRATATALAMDTALAADKPQVALQIFEGFGDAPDPAGQAHYQAARASLLSGETDAALKLVAQAKEHLAAHGAQASPDLLNLEAGIYTRRAQNLFGASRRSAMETAIGLYERSILEEPTTTALFNLGLLQQGMADLDPASRSTWLDAAAESFTAVLARDPDDTGARFQLGVVALANDDPQAAYESLNTALITYREQPETRDQWMVPAALRGRGTARLRLAQAAPDHWDLDAALADLEQAKRLGDTSAELYNNLLVAYLAILHERGGDDPGIQDRLDEIITRHGRQIDPLNLGVTLVEQARAALNAEEPERRRRGYRAAATAASVFARNLEVSDTPSAEWSAASVEDRGMWRWLGHAHRLAGRLAEDPEVSAGHLTDALAAYGAAGARSDRNAQAHYLALAGDLDADTALAAALDVLRWRTFLSLDAWRLTVASYGPSGRWREPLHLGIWGGLILLCLVMALRARAKRRRVATSDPSALTTVKPAAAPAPVRPTSAPEAKPGTAPEAPTLRPKTQVKKPDRGQALERRPSGEVDVRRPTPRRDRSKDETYLPGEVAPEAAQARRAVSDIARRLAREQDQSQAGGGEGKVPGYTGRKSPRPRRRR